MSGNQDHRDAQMPSEEELRVRLGEHVYNIVRRKGTERAFTGRYWNCSKDGIYHCIVCGDSLFSSGAKYDSGSGWPSYWQALTPDKVITHNDFSHGMIRSEVVCGRCGSHLGHVFPDGPAPTELRYCINSAALSFKDESQLPLPDSPA